MQKNVRNAIIILNGITISLDNLNKLGIYLAKQNNTDALQVLKLLILASETKKISKPFDINSENKYMYFKEESGRELFRRENIVDNLSVNPHFFALELMEYIIQNYPVDLDFKPYCDSNSCTTFYNWINSFRMIEYDDSIPFYEKHDIIDKKIEMIDFMATNELLNQSQIAKLLNTYKNCLNEKNQFTKEQLLRMQKTLYKINQYEIDTIVRIPSIPNIKTYDACLENAKKELNDFKINNSACDYMIYNVYELIRQKKIR